MQRQKARVMAQSVRRLLRRSASGHLNNLLLKLHPADISEIFHWLNDREQRSVFALLLERDRSLCSETLKALGMERGRILLEGLTTAEISQLLQEMESDAAAEFIAELPGEVADEILKRMRVEESEGVQELLQYEEETAGRIMTPDVFCLGEELSASDAIRTIQTTQDLEMVFYLYVVDERRHLVGVVSLRQLIMVPPSTPLKKIMTSEVISVTTDTDQEEVARQVALYDLLALPVVDAENKLVGIITVDDVIDVIKDEATEDIFYLAGVEASDHSHTRARESIRKRLPWLALHLGTALLAATVVALYEPTIAEFSYLAVFLPVVAALGGSSGIQTLTVIVRGLALGEVTWAGSRQILFKETLVGVGNGVFIGMLAGTIAWAWQGNYMLGVILGCAMIVNMFVAGMLGTLVPILLKRMGFDPAIGSNIFVTTLTDAVGFFSFLALAAYLLTRLEM